MIRGQDRAAFHRRIAAALVVGWMLSACGAPVPTATAPPTPVSSRSLAPIAIQPSSPRPVTVPSEVPTAPPLFIGVNGVPSPAFAGDPVTLTVSSLAGGGPSLPIATATVAFGDGTTATLSGACGPQIATVHSYQRAGDYAPTVTALTTCPDSQMATPTASFSPLHIFPSAPPASVSWPTCSTFQLHMAVGGTGAGLGNVATQIAVTNVSARACTLEGYPSVVLVGAGRRLLPTQATPAITGDYMFPAVVPHRVALAPGDVATFMLGYGDNPSGAAVNEPYDVACPVAVAVRVILPGTHEYGTAQGSIAPCGGIVSVSPIVPGAARLTF